MITRRAVAASIAASLVAKPAFAAGDDYAAAKAYSRERRGVSFLVLNAAGATVAEDYPNEGGPDRAWELASGTKSFCGIALAAAVKDGLLRVDQPCADVLTEWRGDALRSRITVRHLLSLTSGLQGGALGRPPPYAEAIATAGSAELGARFAYGPIPFQVFGEILRRVTGGDPLTYYQRRIFDPIGVRPSGWRRGRDGMPHLPSGAQLTARDWGRFGVATLNGWTFGAGPTVDPTAFADNFQGTTANPGYGLSWWLLRPGLRGPSPRAGLTAETIGEAGLTEDIVMAAGAGNQRLYLLRKRRLVVVRQASGVFAAMMGRGSNWSDGEFLQSILR